MLLADFIKAWPFVYHITFLRNLNAIRMLRKLYTAEQVLDRAGQIKIAERRREKDVIVSLGALTFIIRSQQKAKGFVRSLFFR